MKKFKYQHLVNEIKENKGTYKDISELLNITTTTLRSKLDGKEEWKKNEIDSLCSHFKKSYYELFKEDEIWKISEFKGEGICEIEDLKSG